MKKQRISQAEATSWHLLGFRKSVQLCGVRGLDPGLAGRPVMDAGVLQRFPPRQAATLLHGGWTDTVGQCTDAKCHTTSLFKLNHK